MHAMPGTPSTDLLDQVGDLSGLFEAGEMAGGLEHQQARAGDVAGVGVPLSRSRAVLVTVNERDREGYPAVLRAR
jgi:hypothetical protein